MSTDSPTFIYTLADRGRPREPQAPARSARSGACDMSAHVQVNCRIVCQGMRSGTSFWRTCPPRVARFCCHLAAITIKVRPPWLAIRPVTWHFVVAGAGFEPATSGL